MKILDGKAVAQHVKKNIAVDVEAMIKNGKKRPHLAAVLVGNDPASETYVAAKERACKEVGFESTIIKLPVNITEAALLDEVQKLNENKDIDGFIVQLPLPRHIREQVIIENILPEKDVDGFHPVNVGRMSIGLPCYLPATPAGILELLNYYQIQTSGKRCAVIGRSNIVGKPMAILLAQKGYDATVTLCHSKTDNLKNICQTSDIIVAALGVPEFLTKEYIKEGVVVIDVGINRVPCESSKSGYKLVGDVKFEEVAPHCSAITPVPGGVGVMTIVSLLKNTLQASNTK